MLQNLPLNNRGYDDHDTARRDTESADIRKDWVVQTLMQNATFSSLRGNNPDLFFEIAAQIYAQLYKHDDNIDIGLAGYMAGLDLDTPEAKGIIAGAEHYLFNLSEG